MKVFTQPELDLNLPAIGKITVLKMFLVYKMPKKITN